MSNKKDFYLFENDGYCLKFQYKKYDTKIGIPDKIQIQGPGIVVFAFYVKVSDILDLIVKKAACPTAGTWFIS